MKYFKIIGLLLFCFFNQHISAQDCGQMKILLGKTSPDNTDSMIFIRKQFLHCLEKDLSKREEFIMDLNALANLNMKRGNLSEANEYSSKATLLAEKFEKNELLAQCYYIKGQILYNQKEFNGALSYFQNGVVKAKEVGDKKSIAIMLSQIGFMYAQKENLDSALYFQQEALNIKIEIKDTIGIANSYSNLGYIYYLKGKSNITREYYYKAAAINKTSKDLYTRAASLIDCASVEQESGNNGKAIELMNQALKILKESKYYILESNCYQSIAIAYEEMHKIDSAYKYHKLYKLASDSVLNQQTKKALIQSETKFQLTSKQNEIDLLNEKSKNHELSMAKERFQKWIFIVGLVFLLIILFFVYRQLKIKKEAFKKINEQKDIIEQKQKEILDSIRYAKRIQSSLLPTEKYIEKTIDRVSKKE